jgi:hypothetical protein
MEVVVEKKCCRCHETKPIGFFYVYPANSKGISKTNNTCRQCINKRNKIHITNLRQKKTKKNKLLRFITSILLTSCKLRTKARNSKKEKSGKVTLTHEWILDQLKLGYCQGSFPPIPLVFDQPGSPFSPSLDRIDSSNYDYTPRNVRVVCVGINQARSDLKDKDILTVTESLSGFIKKRRNSI